MREADVSADAGGEGRNQQYRMLACQLIECVDQGDEAGTASAIDELTKLRELELFRELGALTRDLHEALKSFRVDTRIGEIAETEIPDARERLNHVISVTEQAAHRTLTAVETSLPLVDELGSTAHELAERWQRFRQRELSADEFRELSRDVAAFLQLAEAHGAGLQRSLTDALMAQDYQDITGQIIRRVISLVQEVEDSLVELVRISGARFAEEKPKPADTPEQDINKGHGPAVPGQDAGVVTGQDEVDDLLSSLGF
jgi:chemotaxis protein CheZ